MGTETNSNRRRTWLQFAFLGALLAFVAFKLFSSIGDIAYVPGSDEGYYLRYTQTVADEGPAGLRTNFDDYLGNRGHWKYPNPFRIGFFCAAAMWSKAFGASFESLSYFSATSHLLLIAVVFAFARRHFDRGKAELIAVAIAFSPLLLGLGRRALMDSFATLTSVLAICTFVDALHDEARAAGWGRWVRFGLAFGLAILVKETTILLLAPFAAWVLIERRDTARAFVALVAAPAVCAIVYVVVAGGFDPVMQLARIIIDSPETNRYALRNGAGPWYRYLLDFMLMSPWPLLLSLGALGAIAVRARTGDADRLPAFFALLFAVLIAEYALFTKNLRYVAVLELPIRILAVHFLWDLVRLRSHAKTIAVCAVLVTLNAWSEVATFDTFFVERGVYDPVSRMLLRLREFIPR